MSIIKDVKTTKKEDHINNEVLNQAHDESAWDKKTEVTPKLRPTSIRLSARTIERAKFFARIHKERGYQSWIKRIIEERISTEYEMYKRLRKEIV